MKMKTLIAVAIAGAFAVPFAAQASADNDRMILAQAGGSSGGSPGSSGAPGGATGGAAAQGGSGTQGATGAAGASQGDAGGGQGNQAGGPGAGVPPTDITQLDKNNDGYVSRDEMSADPRAGNFDDLDKDRDGRLSRDEWAAGSAATGGTTK